MWGDWLYHGTSGRDHGTRPPSAFLAGRGSRELVLVGATREYWVPDREKGPLVKIRAAVLEEFGAPLNVTDVELAEPRSGEVLVRVEACGVCHTDMYTASGADPSG